MLLLYSMLQPLERRHNCIFLNCPIPSFVHAYTFPYHVSLFIGLRGGMRHNNAVNEHSTSSVGHMVILCCFLLIHYLPTAVIFMNFELPTWVKSYPIPTAQKAIFFLFMGHLSEHSFCFCYMFLNCYLQSLLLIFHVSFLLTHYLFHLTGQKQMV